MSKQVSIAHRVRRLRTSDLMGLMAPNPVCHPQSPEALSLAPDTQSIDGKIRAMVGEWHALVREGARQQADLAESARGSATVLDYYK